MSWLGFYLYNAYDGYYYIGNPYIRLEKSNFFKLAFQLSKSKFKVTLSQSYSYVKDYIMGVTDSVILAMNFLAKGIRVYSNIPVAMLYGADLQILYNPVKGLHSSIFQNTHTDKLNPETLYPWFRHLKTLYLCNTKETGGWFKPRMKRPWHKTGLIKVMVNKKNQLFR